MVYVQIALALASIMVALLLLHRAMPVALTDSKTRAWKVWLLALTLGTFGVHGLNFPLPRLDTAIIAGQAMLLLYGVLRLLSFSRRCPVAWGAPLPKD
jgi:hypothetical protein